MTEYGDQQAQTVLRFIDDHIKTKGYPPSRREIRDHLGHAAVSTTHRVIKNMVRDGLIEVDPHIDRGIRIVRSTM